jgi:hypothetical protein
MLVLPTLRNWLLLFFQVKMQELMRKAFPGIRIKLPAGFYLKELLNIAGTSDPHLYRIIYWCAKEAAYKYACMEGLEFKSHIKIHPFLKFPRLEAALREWSLKIIFR